MRSVGGERMRTGVNVALAAMATLVVSCTSSHSARSESDRVTIATQLARDDGARDVAPYSRALAELDAHCIQDPAELARIVEDTFRAAKHLPLGSPWDPSRLEIMNGFRNYELPIHPTATDLPSECATIGTSYLYYIEHDE
jgi:hypothetical protein